MANHLYWLTTHTNMHVGSGDTNYGVIDNLVQRDVLTELPTIHESGLKGALKEFCTHHIKKETGETDTKEAHKDPRIKLNFGNDDDSGYLKFFGAYLLSFPVRTDGNELFLTATCPALLKDFQKYAELLGITLPQSIKDLSVLPVTSGSPLVFNNNLINQPIEYRTIKTVLSTGATITPPNYLGGNSLVLMSNGDAKKVVGLNKLPVLARNSLQDGESKNLWYEEVVPRETKFYFFVQDNVGSDFTWLNDQIKESVVQVGGNASIGQGLCKILKHPNP